METIFRIEHPDNQIGPYNNHEYEFDWCEYAEIGPINRNHPLPKYDGSELRTAYARLSSARMNFGFKSLNALFDWFYLKEWIRIMDENGFMVVVIHIEEDAVVEGNHQLIFDKYAPMEKCYITFSDAVSQWGGALQSFPKMEDDD